MDLWCMLKIVCHSKIWTGQLFLPAKPVLNSGNVLFSRAKALSMIWWWKLSKICHHFVPCSVHKNFPGCCDFTMAISSFMTITFPCKTEYASFMYWRAFSLFANQVHLSILFQDFLGIRYGSWMITSVMTQRLPRTPWRQLVPSDTNSPSTSRSVSKLYNP